MMKEILNSLNVDEKLGAHRFSHLVNGFDLRYKIGLKPWYKTLPFSTINAAFNDHLKYSIIDRKWYNEFNRKESSSRPCNLGVLRSLLKKYDEIKSLKD